MPKLVMHNHSRFCDSTCGVCAREFWKWLKSRMSQMSVVLEGNGMSFAEAAGRSFSGNSTSQTETTCHTLSSVLSDLALAPF